MLSFGWLFPWLDLPYCDDSLPCETLLENIPPRYGLNTPATNFTLGFRFARWVCTNLNYVFRSLFIVGLKWAEIATFISDLLLYPCIRQRSGMIRFEYSVRFTLRNQLTANYIEIPKFAICAQLVRCMTSQKQHGLVGLQDLFFASLVFMKGISCCVIKRNFK